jgi:alanine racemase
MDELAVTAGTFNYEFACDLGKRVPRVYVQNGSIVGTKDYYDDDYKLENISK